MIVLNEKIKKLRELCAGDQFMLNFIDDLEKEINEREKKLHDDMKEMVDGMFKNRIPRNSSMYINY